MLGEGSDKEADSSPVCGREIRGLSSRSGKHLEQGRLLTRKLVLRGELGSALSESP